MRKRDLLKGAAAAALLAAAPFRLAAQLAKPPARKRMNLLFITADDLDWSMPGFMNGRQGITPNLDALAARSHRLVNNRTVAPICMPSREAMMTGLLPHHSGGTGFVPVKEGTPTLTTVLQGQGYFAAAIHKVDHMAPQSCFPWNYAQRGKDRHTLLQAQGARVAIAEAKAQLKPFFLNCNINDPHRPFYGSPAARQIDHDQTGPYAIPSEFGPADIVVPPMLDDLPAVRQELAQYWNSVRRLDIAVGHILTALKEADEADNTVIVFCSDHGMPFPFSKATCYDHGTRVPVLISWPDMGEPKSFDALTTNVDILPTLLELLGLPAPLGLDGRSWMPMLRDEQFARPEFTVTYVETVSSGVAYPMRALQDERYALLFSPWSDGKLELNIDGMRGLTYPAMVEAAKTDPAMAARVKQCLYGVPLALYDLQDDPGQRKNLIHDHRQVTRVARMKNLLMKEMERTGDPRLDNYRTMLAGGQPVVTQNPERYRMTGGDE